MEHLLQQITPLISEYGLIIIFFGMILEGLVMIFVTGFLCHMGIFSFQEAWIAAYLGAIAGDQVWFYLGRSYGRKILNKFPRLQVKLTTSPSFFNSKADFVALFARFVYSGAIIFPLALGIQNYSKKRYLLLDSIGDSIWAFIGISLGYYFANGIELLFGKIVKIEHLLSVVIVLFIIVLFFKRKMIYKNR